MNPKRRPNFTKRRQFYIKKEFQAGFIVRFVMILVLGSVLTVGSIYLNTQDTLTSVYANSRLSIENTCLAIMPSVVFTTIVTTGVLGLVAAALTLLVSHKIAGPMFRFEKDIHRIAKGDLKNRIHIRKEDQLQDLKGSLNQMIDSLSGRIMEVRELCDERVKRHIDEKFQL